MLKLFVLATSLALSLVHAEPTKSIVELAIDTDDLSTLVSVLTIPDYKPVLDALSGSGPFTVFAPTNEAFEKAGLDVSDVDDVTNILQYHVINGAVKSADLSASQIVQSLNGIDLDITKRWGTVRINKSSRVVAADNMATNGIVHLIDTVLIPPPSIVETAIATPDLSTLVQVLTMPGYEAVLRTLSGKGPFTVFAPTNEAFAEAGLDVRDVSAVTEILKYHVISGAAVKSMALKSFQKVPSVEGQDLLIRRRWTGITINEAAKVVVKDVEASNGVVHVINSVLIPDSVRPTLIETAVATPDLSTLVKILTSRGYDGVLSALSGEGPFTVFAPTNEAFARAGIDLNNVDAVVDVLKYHVLVGSKVASTDLSSNQVVEMLNGKDTDVRVRWGRVFINSARVVRANVRASNAIIHLIDKVLVPSPSIVQAAVATPDLSTLVAVLTAPGYEAILAVLSGKGSFTVFAPTNEAFAAAGVDVTDVEAVTEVLKYHVIAGLAVKSTDLKASQDVQSSQGEMLHITRSSSQVTINGYAEVVTPNVECSNGIVHIIDAVLIPNSLRPSIIDTAVATPALSTLVTVLTSPAYKPVLSALSGDGPFTVFAPTNEAFAEADLDVRDVEAVTEVLKYHVVPGYALMVSDLQPYNRVDTLHQEELVIRRRPDRVTVNSAEVVVADVLASNGVVHVIDEVLEPSFLRSSAFKKCLMEHLDA